MMQNSDQLDHLELPPAPHAPAAFLKAVRTRRRRRVAAQAGVGAILCVAVASVSILALRPSQPVSVPSDPRIADNTPDPAPEPRNPRVALAWQGIGDPPPIPETAPPLRLGFGYRNGEIERLLRQ